MPPKEFTPTSLSKDDLEMLRLLHRVQGRRPAKEAQPKAREGQWYCHHKDCIFAVKHKPMFSHRKECMGCYRPKNRAMNPPQALRLPPGEPTMRKKAPATSVE